MALDRHYPIFAPLGRIHEPLTQLAGRVHAALLIREKTVWIDNNGYVFATPADQIRTMSPHATIGLYAKWTPLPMIELGLRRALRERASAWIVDWSATYSLGTRTTDHHGHRLSTLRKRKRKTTATRTRTTETQAPSPVAERLDRQRPRS
jgi:hypothetical protein